ncbi:MAG: helix-turn-helix domain-containing protein [Bacteroidaceae bacterium]|nr:helix-turn-helix domain-containing protein [Bacteroidaceae bacterium]
MTEEKAYFKVWQHRKRLNKVVFSYADYFIVSLFLERGKLSYADKCIEIEPGTIVFANPALPSAWEPLTEKEAEKGFSCMFTYEFIKKEEWGFFLNTPLLDLTLDQAIFLNKEAMSTTKRLFQRMIEVSKIDDGMKDEMMHSILHLIIYESMHGKEERVYKVQHNAAQRTVELFLLLLDRQFPLTYPKQKLEMRSAVDYAQRLSIHVNHLNRVVKQVTGKTTTDIIASRITKEAINLLQNTQLNVAEVAYALGFEEQASFTTFLKRRLGKGPKEVRGK